MYYYGVEDFLNRKHPWTTLYHDDCLYVCEIFYLTQSGAVLKTTWIWKLGFLDKSFIDKYHLTRRVPALTYSDY